MTSRLYLIPLYLSFMIVFGPFLLYGIGLNSDNLEQGVPFISDTGAFSPGAPIFTILFNIGALLVGITVYIRHQIFDMKYNNLNETGINCATTPNTKILNNLSIVCGVLTVIGLSIIGNFRSSEMNTSHNIGTYITCVFGTFDIILQSIIAYNNNCTKTSIIRSIIAAIIIPNFFGYVFIEVFNNKIENNIYVKNSLNRNVSAVCEWIGFCLFGPFYATFIPEFREIKFFKIVLSLTNIDNNYLIRSDK